MGGFRRFTKSFQGGSAGFEVSEGFRRVLGTFQRDFKAILEVFRRKCKKDTGV